MVRADETTCARHHMGVICSDVRPKCLPPKTTLHCGSPSPLTWRSSPVSVVFRTTKNGEREAPGEIVGIKPEHGVGQRISINRVCNKLRELIRHSKVMRSVDPATEEPASPRRTLIVQSREICGFGILLERV